MKFKVEQVAAPNGEAFNANESFMKPVYARMGDLLVDGRGPKFSIVCGTAWYGKLETEAQEFVGKLWTVKERLLTCSSFTTVTYNRRLGEYEVELHEEKK